MTTEIKKLESMAQIREANKALGHFWFEPDTMRFFKSRIESDVLGHVDGNALFITTEQAPDSPRAYTIRAARPDGSIFTVGEFQAYSTRRGALSMAREIIARGAALED